MPVTDDTVIEDRLERARQLLAERDVDALVCFPSSNMHYLAGFDEEPMERHLFLFVTPERELFVAPEMYDAQIADESPVTDVRTWGDNEDPTALLEIVGDDLGLAGGRLLVDDRMWALFTQDLRATFPDASFGLASEVLEEFEFTRTRPNSTRSGRQRPSRTALVRRFETSVRMRSD